jgi:hypothetical protein
MFRFRLSAFSLWPSAVQLRRYFSSGWVFLIPYLATYLLYYVLRWPVNRLSSGGSGSADLVTCHLSLVTYQWVPCLLNVYWALHAINVGLATVALVFWWRENSTADRRPAFQLSAFCDALQRLAPWLLLALLFYIPGVYLEFPADTWQHYSRINEWSWLNTVGEHSCWAKSSYFLAYSLVGRISPPTRQLFWLDFYYTGCCLLLCWQYYRLARAVGLGERASMLFVILQSVLFGNNIFGFYRYYGISSSIFAQLGAVALTRIAIEYASQKFQVPRANGQGASTKYQVPSIKFQGNRPELLQEATEKTEGIATAFRRFPSVLWPLTSALCLLVFIAFNHPQGLGIAGLGLAAVTAWRLIEWRHSLAWWLAAATLLFCVIAILWFPRDPAIDQIYRPQGWFTKAYTFNIFSPQSGAFDRDMWVLGLFGVLNLFIGLQLLRHNHVVSWLTGLPVLAQCLPFVTIPLAGAILQHNPNEGVITCFRMLFAVPGGLAMVTVIASMIDNDESKQAEGGISSLSPDYSGKKTSRGISPSAFAFGLIALASLLVVPANKHWYNHFFNAIAVPPGDLSMHHVVAAADALTVVENPAVIKVETIDLPEFVVPNGFLATPGIGYVLQSTAKATHVIGATRFRRVCPASATDMELELVGRARLGEIHAMPFWPKDNLYTAFSLSAILSGHWPSNEVALEHSAQEELFRGPIYATQGRRPPQLWLEWTNGRDGTHYSGIGAGTPLQKPTEDRGDISLHGLFEPPSTNDMLVLRPVLRTLDGSGWRVAVNITGPKSFHRFFEEQHEPKPLGGETWNDFDIEVRFALPGTYSIELIGDVAWPSQEYRVLYSLIVRPKEPK